MLNSQLLGCALALQVTAAPDARDQGPDKLDVSSFPPQQQENYRLFVMRCSKCHSLARPLNARLKGEQWKGYLKKMIRRPASGISEEAAQKIYEFLSYVSARSPDSPAPPPALPAEASELPAEVQVELLSKMSTYVATFAPASATAVKVLVVSEGASSAGAKAVTSALTKERKLGRYEANVMEVPFGDAKSFETLLLAEDPQVIFLAPELVSQTTAAVVEVASAGTALTVSGVAEHVRLGVVLGFSLVEARPRVLINLKQAQRKKISFLSGLVSHSIVVDR